MTSRITGDIIQCQEISSTSDLFSYPFESRFVFKGRNSYRRSFNPLETQNTISMNEIPIIDESSNNSLSTRFATVSVVFIFLTSILVLFLVYSTFPKVTDEERQHLKVPWNIEDAKNLGIVLNKYKIDNYYQVMAGVFIAYIFLQTFAIPGSLFLSILSGFLFPFFTALALVCTCSMLGASLCFLLSQLLGRKLVLRYFPERARNWAVQVEKHKSNMFNYIVFLRVTPFLPNWFINLTAPVIGVPLYPFAVGTFFGVAPPSFIAIQGGQTLQEMTASDTAFNLTSLMWLLVFGIVSLIPIFLKGKIREKIE
ncbi:transmembrane protein 41 homolog isoform X1 [Diorhabda carinulata]|uniref:transmembrane protein 41 homolog isoform X1 n=1 Tax=Diorhabda carinulata TaxID=1163345 RepID=UPI0025A1FB19|nr:transmembrane protein 41 homolog isoform X1 [Diorhabda carinulata]